MTHSECSYTVQPFADDMPEICGRPAIRHLRNVEQDLDMTYCARHWHSVQQLPLVADSIVTDLVPEEC